MPGDFQLPRKDHTYKALNRAAGKALHRYGMLEDGDRVVVGVSGGKDSLTLLWLLSERLGRIPHSVPVIPGLHRPWVRSRAGE